MNRYTDSMLRAGFHIACALAAMWTPVVLQTFRFSRSAKLRSVPCPRAINLDVQTHSILQLRLVPLAVDEMKHVRLAPKPYRDVPPYTEAITNLRFPATQRQAAFSWSGSEPSTPIDLQR